MRKLSRINFNQTHRLHLARSEFTGFDLFSSTNSKNSYQVKIILKSCQMTEYAQRQVSYDIQLQI